MIELNWLPILASALIPLFVGSLYYNPKVLGSDWIKTTGLTQEELRHTNMTKIFALTVLFGLFIAVFLMPNVLHAIHLFSLSAAEGGGPTDPNSDIAKDAMAFYAKYGGRFRTFGHGAFHGVLVALFGAWPILGTMAIFERKSWKYTAIHVGYWVITLALMGGVICAYGVK